MSILQVENITFGFGDKILLKDLSFRLLKGEHAGLVGANGVGKTTFLKLLMGNLIPDSGNLYKPSSIKIGYLEQHSELEEGSTIREVLKSAFKELYRIEKKMILVGEQLAYCKEEETEILLKEFAKLQDKLSASDFYDIDRLVDEVAEGLGLSALGMDTPVEKLSGGQGMKVKLATLLLRSPDILLLDEPTNYLDKEHVDWLTQYLSSYPNSFIIISHDTEFLNRITNVIYNIEFGYLTRYPGNYETFLKRKEEDRIRYIQQYHRQQKEITKMEEFINKNIVRASTTKRAQSRQKALDKIDRLEKPKFLPKPIFNFLPDRPSGKLVFQCSDLDIGYNYPIIKGLNLELTRGQKVAITGCNGIGKTTLLKTLMGVIPALGGSINFGEFLSPAYYEQEAKISKYTALEEVWNAFPEKSQKEIRAALGKCGLKREDIFQKLSTLSGGEFSKVRLCKLMFTPSNWLILDEPTNHLDVEAKRALKEALRKYEGTILIVSHEKEFYEDLVTDVWDMEKGISFTVETLHPC